MIHSFPFALVIAALLHAGSAAGSPAGPGDLAQAVPQEAARRYRAAEAMTEKGQFVEAERLIRSALGTYPDSGVFKEGHFTEPYYPYFLLGWIEMELGHPDQALAEFDLELARGAIRLDRQRHREITLRRELAECRLKAAQP